MPARSCANDIPMPARLTPASPLAHAAGGSHTCGVLSNGSGEPRGGAGGGLSADPM